MSETAPSAPSAGDYTAGTDELGREMTTYYEARGYHFDAELDNWETGCGGDGYTEQADETFRADTVAALIDKLRAHVNWYGDDVAGMELNSCDETGRVDISGAMVPHRDHEGNILGFAWATETELDAFKRNEQEVWYCTYSFRVERVTREDVDIDTEDDDEPLTPRRWRSVMAEARQVPALDELDARGRLAGALVEVCEWCGGAWQIASDNRVRVTVPGIADHLVAEGEWIVRMELAPGMVAWAGLTDEEVSA